MKLFSKNSLVVATTVLTAGVAFANKPDNSVAPSFPMDNKTYTASGTTDLKTAQMLVNLLRNPYLKVKAEAHLASPNKRSSANNTDTPVYTVHGSTDLKTAKMLVNLLRNPYLKVKAEVKSSSNKNADMFYSISGKTDPATIEKLKALLQNNKHIQITVEANGKNAPKARLNAFSAPSPAPQMYMYKDYQAIIAEGKPFMHIGRPPVFIQGKTLWYPVAVTTDPVRPPAVETKVQKISE